MSNYKEIGQELEKKIIELYKIDKSLKEISIEAGVSVTKINNILNKYHINKRDKDYLKAIKAKNRAFTIDYATEMSIIAYYLYPHSLNDTVKYFNLNNRENVKNILKKYAIELHPKALTYSIMVDNCKKVFLETYGVEHVLQNQEIKEKQQQTVLDKDNTQCVLSLQDFREKGDKTKLEKYGTKNYHNSEKAKQTCLTKYGVDNPSKDPNIKIKKENTCFKHFGVKNPAESKEIRTKLAKKYTYNSISFDSSWEIALYIYAKDNNEEIIYEPTVFSYYYKNKLHCYFPDFIYKGQLIEIKGDNRFNNKGILFNPITGEELLEKHNCMIENNVTIWKHKDIQFALDYIKEHYGRDYLKQFKNK